MRSRDAPEAAEMLLSYGAFPWLSLWQPADCGARRVRQVLGSCLRLCALGAKRHKATVKYARVTQLEEVNGFPATRKNAKCYGRSTNSTRQFPNAKCKAPQKLEQQISQSPTSRDVSRQARQPQYLPFASPRAAMIQSATTTESRNCKNGYKYDNRNTHYSV